MKRHKKFDGSVKPAPIDGFISGGRQLGQPLGETKQPKTLPQNENVPTLGGPGRLDGFRPLRTASRQLENTPEDQEAGLLDEPIVLDDSAPKPKKRYFGSKHPSLRKIFKRGSLGLAVVLILIGGFLFWKLEKDLSKVFHGSIFGIFHTTKLKGEDVGRVNILLAGNSADDPGHGGANLTDSIMIISLDTANNTGYMLSIPRDLYVDYGTTSCPLGYAGKINAVYECGREINFHQSGYPDGGMGLLEKVISQDFGVTINYYSLIDYAGLRDAVNAVGGISFTVKSSDACGLYDGNIDYKTGKPLVDLSNGTHVLNGEQALDLARARGEPPYPSCGYENSDFTRTQNQRQELLSLKSKVLSAGTLSNPLKLTSLLNTFGKSVKTDFKTNEILRLYDLSKVIPNNKIQSVGLADKNINLVKTADIGNQSAVIPSAGQGNYADIRAFIKRLNSNDAVTREDASVVVLNGSGVNGLAASTGTKLTAKGMDVEAVANADPLKKTVVVELNKNKPATKAYLQKTFKVTATTNAAAYPEAENYDADFVIIVGKDAATANTSN